MFKVTFKALGETAEALKERIVGLLETQEEKDSVGVKEEAEAPAEEESEE